MVEIREVRTAREKKEFLDFPLNLYKNNPCFVPPLYTDEKAIFNPKYHYYKTCEAVYYNAYKDGRIVGRISGILQKDANRKYNQKRIRFTRFDSINDQEVADSLFKAVEDWGRSKGMEEVCGPLGFSDLEREGLLIEGFDQMSTFEEQYNADYYQTLISNLGYEKEVDWIERQIRNPKEDNSTFEHLSEMLMKKFNLHIGKASNTSQWLKKYGDQVFDLIDKSYENIYQTVPFTNEMKASLISSFKLIVDLKHVVAVLDENDKIVCFGVCFPAIGPALRKSRGHLTPLCIAKVLHACRHPKTIDLALVGVDPAYNNYGISAVIALGLKNMLKDKTIEYADTNLCLENNYNITNLWKRFDATENKRRRSYLKKI